VVYAVQYMVSRYLTSSLAQECIEYFSDPSYQGRQLALAREAAPPPAAGQAGGAGAASNQAAQSTAQTLRNDHLQAAPTSNDPMWTFCQAAFASAAYAPSGADMSADGTSLSKGANPDASTPSTPGAVKPSSPSKAKAPPSNLTTPYYSGQQ
jgi:hypothetical protein